MKLRRNEYCPIHRSLFCCGRDQSKMERRLRLGIQRIEDPHHPRRYRELRSPVEMRKQLNRKIVEQNGKCAICYKVFTEYSDIVPGHRHPKGMGGAWRDFNMSCFTTPPIVGADGIGTDFGDSATGIVDGPGQFNIELSEPLGLCRWAGCTVAQMRTRDALAWETLRPSVVAVNRYFASFKRPVDSSAPTPPGSAHSRPTADVPEEVSAG